MECPAWTALPRLSLYYHKVEDDLPNSFQLPMSKEVWDVCVPMRCVFELILIYFYSMHFICAA